jgi:hypothetical protein
MKTPKSFGFEYTWNGKEFATHVLAESIEEARARLASVARAKFVGEVRSDDGASVEPQTV